MHQMVFHQYLLFMQYVLKILSCSNADNPELNLTCNFSVLFSFPTTGCWLYWYWTCAIHVKMTDKLGRTVIFPPHNLAVTCPPTEYERCLSVLNVWEMFLQFLWYTGIEVFETFKIFRCPYPNGKFDIQFNYFMSVGYLKAVVWLISCIWIQQHLHHLFFEYH